jgi:hypothetical protein
MLKYKILLLALFPGALLAQNSQCVLQEQSLSRTSVKIEERGDIRRTVIQGKCIVDFRARIGANWHSAHGEYTWTGDKPVEQACGMAVSQAERLVIDRVSHQDVTTERLLICNDDERHRTLNRITPGTVAPISQFRPHPDYPGEFYHNGTRCRWILDTVWNGRDVETRSGVVCLLQDDKWVVVDKF